MSSPQPPNELPYLHFTSSVERRAPDEEEIFNKLSATMQHITRTMAAHYRHAYRPVHAKSHGILAGKLSVADVLPEWLAPGLFAKPNTYDVIMRFSTNPGDLLADNVSTPKGLAMKILNVKGEMVENHREHSTQDFVCINADEFTAPDPAGFLKQLAIFDKNIETSEGIKHAVSVTARATNAALKVVGAHSATLEGIGAPAVHILGENFSTCVPLRFGNHVAKLKITPGSFSLKRLTGKSVNLSEDYNVIENLIREFFQNETAIWDVNVQLALAGEDSPTSVDEKNFPIEKADQHWPVEKSPWQKIATLTVMPQDSYSDGRQLFADEQLSFSPWHAMAAHQPLGGIMRARLKAYEEAQKYRMQRNSRTLIEPTSISEMPN
jgi:hypothetical protein